FFQMFKSRKPFLRCGMSQAAVIGSRHPMHTAMFLGGQQCVGKLANLRMNVVQAAIKLHKGSVDQFVTGAAPVVLQFRRNGRRGCKRDLLTTSMHLGAEMLTFQAHRRPYRRRSLWLDEHGNLLVTEWQFESHEVG